jgi:hypothetical protein
MKKNMQLILILLLISCLAGCKVNKAADITSSTESNEIEVVPIAGNVDKSDMDEVISYFIIKYLGISYKSTDKQFEAHKIYGTEEADGVIKVYAFYRFMGCSFIEGTFKYETGGGAPILFELVKENDEYDIIGYTEVLVGGDLPYIFPEKYAEMVDERNTDLYEDVVKQAEDWLKEEGRTEKYSR